MGPGVAGAAFAFLYQGAKADGVAGPGWDFTLDSPSVRGDAVDSGLSGLVVSGEVKWVD